MIDQYLTISDNYKYEMKEKGSKFIALTFKIKSIEDAENYISQNKKEYYDATHNCYAYRLGLDGNLFRSNDDCEPSGSAGKPILNAIDQFKITDTLVIVNRYFGGTKLGIPGLVRSYNITAYNAIMKSNVVIVIIKKKITFRFEHKYISSVMHYISINKLPVINQTYDDKVNLITEIRLSDIETHKNKIFENLNGNIELFELFST